MILLDVKASVVKSFKELLATAPLEQITVSGICGKSFISRRTFYKHFACKNSIAEHIIAADITEPIEGFRKLVKAAEMKTAGKFVLELMYKRVYENRDFYFQLFKHGGKPIFIDTVTAELTKMNNRALSSKGLMEVDKEYMAYFYSASQAMLMVKWIDDKMVVSPKQLSNYYYFLAQKNMELNLYGMTQWQQPGKL
jgi:AcrR family transcriptional regulator